MEPLRARVVRAGLSPVKGTRHLSLPQLHLEPYGATRDRRLCLVDVDARRVLRTVQHPALVPVLAEERDGVLSVTLPDGHAAVGPPTPTGEQLVADYWGRPTELAVVDGPHAALFGEHLGRPVALAAAPPRAVVYGAGITLVAQSSLDDLAGRAGLDIATLDPARFRATAVLDTGQPAYAEDGWAGRELRLGTAVLRVGGPIGRCGVIDVDPSTGERGSRLLRTLASYRPRLSSGEPAFGVYAEVVEPGVIRACPPQEPLPGALRSP